MIRAQLDIPLSFHMSQGFNAEITELIGEYSQFFGIPIYPTYMLAKELAQKLIA